MIVSHLFSAVVAWSIAVAVVEPEVEADDLAEVAPQPEHGPAFVAEPVSDTKWATDPRAGRKTPLLSVADGAFCFVDGTYCKTSLILTADVGLGIRAGHDAGPDVPYAQFMFRGGLVARPLALSRRAWHPWGLGVVGAWSRGTGSVTVSGDNRTPTQTQHTDAWRIGVHNQIWFTQKQHGIHLDLTLGAVRSDVLTSGLSLWGTHAEVGFGWGGWMGLFAAGDFLDRDTRVVFGLRGHGLAAGPIIALALAGLALGGAM